MKASQTGASALLGFLSALQQGQEQRNQERQQYLQQQEQQANTDRQFKLQDQQAEFARAAEERAAGEYDFLLGERQRTEPVRKLETATALGQPEITADQITAELEKERAAKQAQLAELQAKIASTRGPARDLLISQYDIINGELADLPTRLTGRLSTIPGLSDPNKFITRFKGSRALPLTGTGTGTNTGIGTGTGTSAGTSTNTGTGTAAPGTTAPGTAGVVAPAPKSKVQRTDQFPLPAATPEDIEAITGAAKSYGLGALGLNYFDMPEMGVRNQNVYVPGGKDRVLRAGYIKHPENIGLNTSKFVEAEMPKIQEALKQSAAVGVGRHLGAEESLKLILGSDKSIWPVNIDENDNVTPKTNFYASLTPEQKLRLNSVLAPLIKPDDAIIEQVKEARRQRVDSLNTTIKDMTEYRDQVFKTLTDQYDQAEAYKRAKLTQTAKTGPEQLTVAQKLADSNAIRTEVSDAIASDASIATELSKSTAKVEEVLLGMDSVNAATKVPINIIRAFYQQRSSNMSRRLNSIMVSEPANTIGDYTKRNSKMYGIKTAANNDAIKYIRNTFVTPRQSTVPGGRPNTAAVDKELKAIEDWLSTLK